MTIKAVPKSMRALLYDQPAKALKLTHSWPVPLPDFSRDEHLIKVHSIAITNGELEWPFPPEAYQDYSPGVEMSGEVVSSPSGSKFHVGSKVYAHTTSPRSGSAREYTIALGSELAMRPSNLTSEQAASVPISALTAWQALFVQPHNTPVAFDDNFELQKDGTSSLEKKNEGTRKTKLLIIGASGSVGLWATQLASATGDFQTYGTCHTRNILTVQSYGADQVIDRTQTPNLKSWLTSNNATGTFDLVLDCFTPGGSPNAWYAAQPSHGLILSIVLPLPDNNQDANTEIKWILENRPEDVSSSAATQGKFFILESDGDQLAKIAELIERGKVKLGPIDGVYEMEEYEKAFERVSSGKARGKVVVRISPDVDNDDDDKK